MKAMLALISLFCSLLLSVAADEQLNISALDTSCEHCTSTCEQLADARVEASTAALKASFPGQIEVLEKRLKFEQDRLSSSEAAREDLNLQLETLQKDAENSIIHKNKAEELERELIALQKSLDDSNNETAKKLNHCKVKILEARNERNDLHIELMAARERLQELHLHATTTRINVTLILEDAFNLVENTWERSVGFATWLHNQFPSWDGILEAFQSSTDLVMEQYRQRVVPSITSTLKVVQEWYDATLRLTVKENGAHMVSSWKQSAAIFCEKVFAAANFGLKRSCRKILDYLNHNVEVKKESSTRKWVISQLEHLEKLSEDVVLTAGKGIIVVTFISLILSLARKKARQPVEERPSVIDKSESQEGFSHAAGVGRTTRGPLQ